jgi:HTH-type transcriptional regulator/antitoxin HigA
MAGIVELAPRWASPPGRTIRAILDQMGRPVDDLSELLSIDNKTAADLLNDQAAISPDLAERLSESLGASPGFWTKRYAQYQEDLLRVEADQWARSAPSELFSTLGWVERTDSWTGRIQNLLDFFGVPDLPSWQGRYEPALAGVHYRRSNAFDSNDVAVAAWLRRAQLEARSIPLSPWNAQAFADSMANIRKLTWLKEPGEFLPRLAAVCASAGVALVVVRTPHGCPVSGATYTTEEGAALIVLSARYLSDDHLWFTFFHEAAHLLLHPSGSTFIDWLDSQELDADASSLEGEANSWASARILADSLVEECRRNRLTHRFVLTIAHESGVAPGLVVGQLQHLKLLPQNQLNKLKRRYRWNGPSLETA